jgi:hypothetical protein
VHYFYTADALLTADNALPLLRISSMFDIDRLRLPKIDIKEMKKIAKKNNFYL